jgi:uncharacterized DUF497 family protein
MGSVWIRPYSGGDRSEPTHPARVLLDWLNLNHWVGSPHENNKKQQLVEFVWDENKAARNPAEHDGVTFEDAATALDDPYALVAEDGGAEGEHRFKLVGTSAAGHVLVVVYAYRQRAEAIRIISAWKATGPARQRYEQKRP